MRQKLNHHGEVLGVASYELAGATDDCGFRSLGGHLDEIDVLKHACVQQVIEGNLRMPADPIECGVTGIGNHMGATVVRSVVMQLGYTCAGTHHGLCGGDIG